MITRSKSNTDIAETLIAETLIAETFNEETFNEETFNEETFNEETFNEETFNEEEETSEKWFHNPIFIISIICVLFSKYIFRFFDYLSELEYYYFGEVSQQHYNNLVYLNVVTSVIAQWYIFSYLTRDDNDVKNKPIEPIKLDIDENIFILLNAEAEDDEADEDYEDDEADEDYEDDDEDEADEDYEDDDEDEADEDYDDEADEDYEDDDDTRIEDSNNGKVYVHCDWCDENIGKFYKHQDMSDLKIGDDIVCDYCWSIENNSEDENEDDDNNTGFEEKSILSNFTLSV
jgi:hypothetical protein